ncbi:MAG: hypothetical protein IKU38_02475 [Clostridia bacterium]|nr:hypothetical protein [Clostridia bacterium]
MIDIHQHIVYGIDDGPKTISESLQMLRLAAEHGTTGIIATSHAYSDIREFPLERYARHLEQLRGLCREYNIPIELYEGCEIFYSDMVPRQLEEGRMTSMAGSRYVLVEFEPAVKLDTLCDAVRILANHRYRPVIAHCERYAALHKEIDVIEELKQQFDAGFQMNASAFIDAALFDRRLPGRVRKFRDAMLEQELVDYIASDGHNCHSRLPVLDAAYKWVSKTYDEAYAHELFYAHQMRLLRGARR